MTQPTTPAVRADYDRATQCPDCGSLLIVNLRDSREFCCGRKDTVAGRATSTHVEIVSVQAPCRLSVPTAETTTVREYLEGEEVGPVFLHTHCGTFQVTGVHFFSDGPWLVTGHGFNQASWCVSYGERLYFDKAEAQRSAS